MNKSEAYKIVFDDLMNVNMFKGIYDATYDENTNHFIYGIQTVMENIAYGVSEECYDEFSKMFLANVISSQEEANENRETDVI